MNRDLFFDRPIVPRKYEDLESQDRFGPFTSEMARSLGQLEAAKAIGLSPFEIDHIVRGYFGTLGTYTVAGVDALTGFLSGDRPPAPEWHLEDYPIMRRLMIRYPHTRQQSVETFYEFRRQTIEAKRSLREAYKRGNHDRAEAIRRERGFEIAMAGLMEGEARSLNITRDQIQRIRQAKDITPEDKRLQIDRLLIGELDKVGQTLETVRLARQRYADHEAARQGAAR